MREIIERFLDFLGPERAEELRGPVEYFATEIDIWSKGEVGTILMILNKNTIINDLDPHYTSMLMAQYERHREAKCIQELYAEIKYLRNQLKNEKA